MYFVRKCFSLKLVLILFKKKKVSSNFIFDLQEKERGDKVGRAKVFIVARRKKDGSYVNDEA